MIPITCIEDLRQLAERRVPRAFFQYVDSGSYAEETFRANRTDMERIKLRQRVLVNVDKRDLSTTIVGQKASLPIALAPVGLCGMQHGNGEILAAQAANEAGVPFCLSTLSICSVEEVTAAVKQPIWFQLYMLKDRGFMQSMLERAAAAKCSALVFTVDLAVTGARYRDIHSGLSATGLGAALKRIREVVTHPAWALDVGMLGGPMTMGNVASVAKNLKSLNEFGAWVASNFDPSVTWRDLEWVRDRWKGPIIIKGVLDKDDVRPALDAGADGIVVSNHGGRQLDGASSTIKALPAIVEAAGGKVPVLLDGGVRSGLDVLRALALGAQGVMIGRAWAFALGAQGEKGVARMLEILRAELAVAMALTGCTDLKQAGAQLVNRS